ncbi:hypothetical protein ACTRXD_00485 [Nitrospira sp. T9]|uniref:hypothetical protein n=1 Tax=unclassified Nitrospira TaxID=2652172 RepID=UPI003F9A7928
MATRIPLTLVPPDMLHRLYARQYPDLTLMLEDIANLPYLTPEEHHRRILRAVQLYEMTVYNRGRPTTPLRL